MADRIRAMVNPQILVWARETSGLSLDQAARKVSVSPERFASWEEGHLKPTMRQLRLLATAYRRPMAGFFSSHLPEDPKPIGDFRRFPDQIAGLHSPQLRFEIRAAHDRRDAALDLLTDLGEKPPTIPIIKSIQRNPEAAGRNMRKSLKVSVQDQVSCRNAYAAFSLWREAVEDLGILVFQATRIDPAEMSGFSIANFPLPVIVVNRKEPPVRRIFTLLHELTHLMLQTGGLCSDLSIEGGRPKKEREMEVLANHVAGAILLPRNTLLKDKLVLEKREDGSQWADSEIARFAGRYKLSRETALRRLLILDCITKDFYEEKRAQFIQEWNRKSKRTGGGPISRVDDAISTSGKYFVSLALRGYYNETVTTRDLSDLLGVKVKHLAGIEEKVIGTSVALGTSL